MATRKQRVSGRGFLALRAQALVTLTLALGSSGCAEQMISRMYSSEFTCPESQVEIETLGPGRFRATGCNRTVVYQCIAGSCIPDRREEEEVRKAERDAAPPPRSESMERFAATSEPDAKPLQARRRKAGEMPLVELDVELSPTAWLKFRASPDKLGELVQMKLEVLEKSDALKRCEIEWLINGQHVNPPKSVFSRKGFTSSRRADLQRDTARDLSTAQQLALRACDAKWSLAPEQLGELHHFMALYEEDLAWKQDASSGDNASMLAPLGGWPKWQAVGKLPIANKSGNELDGAALFKLLAPSVYRVEGVRSNDSRQGSAIAISKTELATNCHVIEGARKLILTQAKQTWVAEVAYADTKKDRCVLRVADATLVPVRGVRAYSDLTVGEPLYTLGSPNGLELSLANGILSGLREEANVRFVQTTAPISPGSSGGGLFDARGNLVGITTWVLLGRNHLNQSLNFAVPAELYFQP